MALAVAADARRLKFQALSALSEGIRASLRRLLRFWDRLVAAYTRWLLVLFSPTLQRRPRRNSPNQISFISWPTISATGMFGATIVIRKYPPPTWIGSPGKEF